MDKRDNYSRLTGSALISLITGLAAATDVVRRQSLVRDVVFIAVDGSVTGLEEGLVVGRCNRCLGDIVVVSVGTERLGGVGGGDGTDKATTKGTAVTWGGDGRANEGGSGEESAGELHRDCG